jgi:disease resistance protein
VREKVELVCEEVDPSLLTCCNGGCQVKKYREEDNHDKACQYHRLGPVFWDGGKYWGCCPDQKKWEWDDFICIPGCTIGRHSNVPPPKMAQEEMTNAPIAVPQGADPLTMHVDSVATYGESDEPAAKEDTVEVADIAEDGSTVCGNAGCRMKFNVNDPRDPSECHYHASPPVFHDGKKGYSCCNVHVYDFDDFMAIPTCAVGTHIPRMKKVKAGGLLDPE